MVRARMHEGEGEGDSLTHSLAYSLAIVSYKKYITRQEWKTLLTTAVKTSGGIVRLRGNGFDVMSTAYSVHVAVGSRSLDSPKGSCMVASVTEILCPIPPWPYAPAQGIVSLYDDGQLVDFSGTVAQQQLSLIGWCKRARQVLFVALMRFVGDASKSEFEIKVGSLGAGVRVKHGDLNTTASAGNLGSALQSALSEVGISSFVVKVRRKRSVINVQRALSLTQSIIHSHSIPSGPEGG